MNKTIITIVIVAVIILGGYFFFKGAYQPPSSVSQPSPQTSAGQGSIADNNTVIYTDTGYSPNILRIKVGTIVTFKNQSSQAMRPASGVHPTHTLYPTTGGCIGSTFDACAGIQPGNNWSFKFDFPGSWKYHNHLNPGDTGTIVVE